MIHRNKQHRPTALYAILAALPLFAACGGETGDEEDDGPSPFIDQNVQYCTSWTLYYQDPATCGGTIQPGGSGSSGGSGGSGGSGSTGGSTMPPLTGGSSTSGVAALVNDELEPNDSMANANVMSYPTRTGSTTHVGWAAGGTIDEVNDSVDYFAFTAPMSRDYTMRLCPPIGSACHGTTGLDSLTAFFEVLDQNGDVLLSSDATGTNAYEMAISAGVAYYVRVVASDTMGAAVAYSFQAFEAL